MTAYLLREIYEGNVKNAQKKIEAEMQAHGRPPYVVLVLENWSVSIISTRVVFRGAQV